MSQGISLGKATVYGMKIILPIATFVLIPFVIWLVLPDTNKHKQLFETLSWVFPTIVVGAGFLFSVGYAIYTGVVQSKARKQ